MCFRDGVRVMYYTCTVFRAKIGAKVTQLIDGMRANPQSSHELTLGNEKVGIERER